MVSGAYFFPTAFDFVSFWYYFGVSYNYETKLRYYLAYLAYFSQLHLILYLFGIIFGVSYNYEPKLKVYLSVFRKR